MSSPLYDGAANVSTSTTLDLRAVLRLVLRNWPWLALALLAGIGAGYLYISVTTPIYRASASLLIETERPSIVRLDDFSGLETDDSDYYQTQFEILRSRSLASKVLDSLDAWDHSDYPTENDTGDQNPGLNSLLAKARALIFSSGGDSSTGAPTADSGVGKASIESETVSSEAIDPPADNVDSTPDGESDSAQTRRDRVVGNFLDRLRVSPVRGTKIVRINYESSDANFAATIANRVGETYITNHLDTKVRRSASAATWLTERVADLEASLADSERRLLKFRSDNGLIDMSGDVGKLNERELLLITNDLVAARTAAADSERAFRQMRAYADSPDLLLTLPAAEADPLVRRTKLDLSQLKVELRELSNRYGPRHPSILDVQGRIDTLNAELRQQLSRVVGALEGEYQSSRQRLRAIEGELDQGKQDIRLLSEKQVELDALEREVSTNLGLYETFYGRLAEARSTDGLSTANATISDRAIVPQVPVKPRRSLVMALLSLISLALAFTLILVRNHLKETVDDVGELTPGLQVPVYGSLPLAKNRGLFSKSYSDPLKPRKIKDGTFVESVNSICTTIGLLDRMEDEGANVRDGGRVLLVTSSVPGEGKSSLAASLAYSFGQTQSVLLIDADMHRPTLAQAVGGTHRSLGLSNILDHSAEVNACMQVLSEENRIAFLSCGKSDQAPLELLSDPSFSKLLDRFRRVYDRIVIDSPPVRAVSDALVIAQHADRAIYLVRAHSTPIEMARRGLDKIRAVSNVELGLVLSQVKQSKTSPYENTAAYTPYHSNRPRSIGMHKKRATS